MPIVLSSTLLCPQLDNHPVPRREGLDQLGQPVMLMRVQYARAFVDADVAAVLGRHVELAGHDLAEIVPPLVGAIVLAVPTKLLRYGVEQPPHVAVLRRGP